MISVREALAIHQVLIGQFGGAIGIRDTGLLESALKRPYATFDQNDLYHLNFESSPLSASRHAEFIEAWCSPAATLR